MGQIRGTEILRQVKARFEPFRGQLAGKKLLIIRFLPPPQINEQIEAKYRAAEISAVEKVKTFTFIEKDLDGMHPNHPLFTASATSEAIAYKIILGDVKRSAYSIPQNITPVPGGVGPLQMAILLERLIKITLEINAPQWNLLVE